MFEDFSINLSDPSKNSFYFPVLAAIGTILLLIQLLIMLLKNKILKILYKNVRRLFNKFIRSI